MVAGQGCGPVGMAITGGVPPQAVKPGEIGQLSPPGWHRIGGGRWYGNRPARPGAGGGWYGRGPAGHGAGAWRMWARPRLIVRLEVMTVPQPRVVAASPGELTYGVWVPSPHLILSFPRPP